MKLTPAYLSATVQDAPEAKSFTLRNKNITHIDDLSTFLNLQRLDLTENALKTGESLNGLCYCHWITWLSVAKNQLEDIQYICKIRSLQVLNASHNKLKVLPWDELAVLEKLKALILNDNQLTAFPPTACLPKSLDTLVLSGNQLAELPATIFRRLGNLTKVSLSHNHLHTLPDLAECWQLKEVRLAGNRISSLKDALVKLPPSLEILDLGHNQLDNAERVLAAFAACPLKKITSLNLKGNPCLPDDAASAALLAGLKSALPELRIFNGRNLSESPSSKAKGPLKRPSFTEVRVKAERQNKNTKLTFE